MARRQRTGMCLQRSEKRFPYPDRPVMESGDPVLARQMTDELAVTADRVAIGMGQQNGFTFTPELFQASQHQSAVSS